MNYSIAVQAFSTLILVIITYFYLKSTNKTLTFYKEKDKKDFAINLLLKYSEYDNEIDYIQHELSNLIKNNRFNEINFEKVRKVLTILELIGTLYYLNKLDRYIIYDFLQTELLDIYNKIEPILERLKNIHPEAFERLEFMANDFKKIKNRI
jgi:hypothetical protein